MSAGLVKFAVQAKISLGLGAVDACAATGRGLTGQHTVDDGLQLMLKGSGCTYRQLDAHAYEIRPAPRIAPSRVASAVPKSTSPDLAELVVVATHRATLAERLPYAVTSVPAATLDAQGVHDLGDLTMLTPGMTVTNLGMGRNKVLLRGLSDGPLTGLTQSLVSLYLDDTRLTFNAPDPDLRLVDIARVEVLRGPQGTLYGAGSLGGVVHIVSAEPDAGRVSARADATYGFTDGGAPSNAEDATINLPLIRDKAAARLVLYHEVDGGYIRNAFLNIDDINRAERDGGRLSLKYAFNNAWDVAAGVAIQTIRTDDTQYATPFNEPPGGPYVRSGIAAHLREPSNNDFHEYHINSTGELGWAVAHASVAYIEHNIFDRYAEPAVSAIGGGRTNALDERSGAKSIVTEETLASEGPSRIQWVAGLFYAHTTETSSFTLTDFGPPVRVNFADMRHDRLDEGALYGEAEVPIVAGWTVTAGGRLFGSHDRVTSQNTTFARPSSTQFTGAVDQVGFAPKLVISDRPLPGLLVYVQAANGYRPPGINTASEPGRPLNPPGGLEPLRFFKSDQLWSYEAGVKLTSLHGRLRLNVAGFDVQWKSVQSDQLLATGVPFTANVGDGRNYGVEIESAFNSGPLQLRADMLFNNPTLNHANTAAFPLLANSSLGAVPDQVVGVSAHYAWTVLGHRLLALDGRWSYVGGSRLMLNIPNLPKEGDYDTGRLAVSLADSHWRLTAAVDNPANSAANTFAYGNPFLLIQGVRQTTPLRPRTISLSLEAWF
jgi:outer membrane receptor protein involved in Fe transport